MRLLSRVVQQSGVVELSTAEIDEAELQITIGLRVLTVVAQKALIPLKRKFVVADDDAV
jgi:hypothetical protein